MGGYKVGFRAQLGVRKHYLLRPLGNSTFTVLLPLLPPHPFFFGLHLSFGFLRARGGPKQRAIENEGRVSKLKGKSFEF